MSAPSLSEPKLWNDVADNYAADTLPFFQAFARDALRVAGVAHDHHVLDVASGPGTLTEVVAPRCAHVAAVDLAPAMVEGCRRRMRALGIGNVTAEVMDGQELSFPGAHFDRAFCAFGLMFYPDPARGLRELWRVLRPGGTAVVLTWKAIERSPRMSLVFEALNRALARFGASLALPRFPLEEPSEIESACASAGFSDLHVECVRHSERHASAAAYFAARSRSAPPVLSVARELGQARWLEISELAIRDLEARLGEGPIELEAEANLAVAQR
jgi:ubiquinone/menaquinone biosynthesis C-methylase UbiE